MEVLERRDWLLTEAEIYLLHSAMFTAQDIIRDMERTSEKRRSSKSAGISQTSRRNCRAAP